MVITSRANPVIKQMRLLRQRRHRDESGLFLVEGERLLVEAAARRAEIVAVVSASELLSSSAAQVVSSLQQREGVRSVEATCEVIASLSPREERPAVAAVARQRWERLEEVRLSGELCWVALSETEHPGSLGTILRVSDAVGGAGIILLGPSADPYDPTAVRASLGAVFSQRLVRASFAEFAAWKQKQGAFVVGASPSASHEYTRVSYRRPTVVLLGNERRGLSPEQEALCDLMVRIPMVGHCDSHHVAVAAALVLYEAFNQRRAAPMNVAQRSNGRHSSESEEMPEERRSRNVTSLRERP